MKHLIKTVATAVLPVAVLLVGFSSCSNLDENIDPSSHATGMNLKSTAFSSECPGVYVDTVTLRDSIIADRILYNDTLYVLDGKVYVKSPAELTINAGTRIEGIYKADPVDASALIITRGAKIWANGTECCPIVFTAHNPLPDPADNVGRWGGLVLLGKATINQGEAEIEGINPPSVPPGVDYRYGGSDDDDCSGSLTYVRVEYAGASIAEANELNSFTFGGVGRGTTLHHLQAYYGADDAFEFFGGTVDAKYLIATAANDDAFDFDFGYKGRLQFLVAVLDPNAPYSSDANGIECDNEGSILTPASRPLTRPVISNLTIVGTSNGTTSDDGTVLYGARFRRNTRFVVCNSIFYGYNEVIHVESDSTIASVGKVCDLAECDSSYFCHNVVGLISGAIPYGPTPLAWYVDPSSATVAVNGIILNAPFNYSGFFTGSQALRPTGGPALTSVCTCLDGWFTATNYKGALSGSDTEYWITDCWVNTDFPIF